jgi:spore coat polysaccharide biosynthesis protein SpsF
VIIQARLGSSRFPKKVFKNLAGHRLIDHVIHRAKKIGFGHKVIVSTTNNGIDDELAEYCVSQHGVLISRGSEFNVFDRFVQTINEHSSKEEFFVRVTADDPLRDPVLTMKSLNLLKSDATAVALVNSGENRFPLGVETEIAKIQNFLNIPASSRNNFIDEHIFPYYRDRIGNGCLKIQPKSDFSKISFTIDYQNDLTRLDKLMANASQSLCKESLELNWLEVLKFLR